MLVTLRQCVKSAAHASSGVPKYVPHKLMPSQVPVRRTMLKSYLKSVETRGWRQFTRSLRILKSANKEEEEIDSGVVEEEQNLDYTMLQPKNEKPKVYVPKKFTDEEKEMSRKFSDMMMRLMEKHPSPDSNQMSKLIFDLAK